IRPTGTQFTTEYTQPGSSGSTVVTVQSGVVEVTDRVGHITTLTAGQQAAFDDTVNRAGPILPVDRGTVTGGAPPPLSRAAVPGAADYLFEYTLSAAGFASANPSTVQSALTTLRLAPPAFTVQNGIVEFSIRIPGGILPPTAPGWWRVFAADAAGAILPATTA